VAGAHWQLPEFSEVPDRPDLGFYFIDYQLSKDGDHSSVDEKADVADDLGQYLAEFGNTGQGASGCSQGNGSHEKELTVTGIDTDNTVNQTENDQRQYGVGNVNQGSHQSQDQTSDKYYFFSVHNVSSKWFCAITHVPNGIVRNLNNPSNRDEFGNKHDIPKFMLETFDTVFCALFSKIAVFIDLVRIRMGFCTPLLYVRSNLKNIEYFSMLGFSQ